jgi:hypothetical protein
LHLRECKALLLCLYIEEKELNAFLRMVQARKQNQKRRHWWLDGIEFDAPVVNQVTVRCQYDSSHIMKLRLLR